MRIRTHALVTAAAAVLCSQAALAILPDDVQRATQSALERAEFGRIARLIENAVPDLHKATITELRVLCYAYHQIKSYRQLFTCLDQWDRTPGADESSGREDRFELRLPPRLWAMSRDTLRAEALIELADYPRAVEVATRAFKRRERDTNSLTYGYQQRLFSLPTLAIAHALNGDQEASRRYAAMFDPPWHLRIAPQVGPEIHIDLARIYAAQGDFTKSLEHAKEADYTNARTAFNALGIFLMFKGGQPVPLQSEAAYTMLPRIYLLNKCLLETGDVGNAKSGFDALLAMPAIRDNGELHWMALYERGRIAEREGRPAEAAEFYRRAIEIIERNRATINTEASKIGYVGNRQNVYGRLVAVLLEQQNAALAFQYAERAKARALVDMLARTDDFALSDERAAQIRALIAQAARAEEAARLQDGQATAPSRRDSGGFASSIAAQSEELASLTSVRIASLEEIRARLQADEALIEYFVTDEFACAFVLRGSTITAVKLAHDNLEANVRRHRRALSDPESTAHAQTSRQLYDQLIGPLAGQLETPNLLIVPHGPLHYVAFAALFDGDRHLVDRYGMRFLPSASVIKYLKRTPPDKPGSVLAIGNPELGNSEYRLAHAREEALRIASLLAKSVALVDENATETALKTLAPGFRYLHIASHGEFVPDAPLQSGLRLAPDAKNDGRITVGELFALRFDADIVTLSACDTGLGAISRGDDVIGLSRGFLYAGSRTIVASLWKVEDKATANLMTVFYEGLGRTDRRDALRRAQIDTREKFPHPFFWGAFQLTGSAQ